jgi:hypothetical protein
MYHIDDHSDYVTVSVGRVAFVICLAGAILPWLVLLAYLPFVALFGVICGPMYLTYQMGRTLCSYGPNVLRKFVHALFGLGKAAIGKAMSIAKSAYEQVFGRA